MAWLGYFASTGVAAIDYVLVDAVSVHPEEQAQFTERLWYLPETGRLGGLNIGCTRNDIWLKR